MISSLRDRSQFFDPLGEAENLGISSAQWPLFGMVWPASIMLAELMMDFDFQDYRILEIGCGMAIPSLVLHSRGANITASDYHPLAQTFLELNLSNNALPKMRYAHLDWQVDDEQPESYDVIIGSDVLYDPSHPGQLVHFLVRHLKENGQVVLTDPDREHYRKLNRLMQDRGFQLDKERFSRNEPNAESVKGNVLRFKR